MHLHCCKRQNSQSEFEKVIDESNKDIFEKCNQFEDLIKVDQKRKKKNLMYYMMQLSLSIVICLSFGRALGAKEIPMHTLE